jgi:NAD+ synthase (glutamine-hydrolysing)
MSVQGELTMRIACVQLNPIVGDIDGNIDKAAIQIAALCERPGSEPDVIVLTELFLTGYPPRDLLFRTDLVSDNLKAKDDLVKMTEKIPSTIIFGYVDRNDKDGGKALYNAVCVAQGGKVLQTRHKTLLPTYDVFEERRYFEPGSIDNVKAVDIKGERVGIVICEEGWNADKFWPTHEYPFDPVAKLVEDGANYLISINASPFRVQDDETVAVLRRKMMGDHCKRHGVGACYVNQVGANDEVIFDGSSFVCNDAGDIIRSAQEFEPDIIWADTKLVTPELNPNSYNNLIEVSVLRALTLGVKDYFDKQPYFRDKKAFIAVSGGIDSAIVAYIARQALGANRVIGVSLPSEFSSDGSKSDAKLLCDRLGIPMVTIPIATIHNGFRDAIDFGLTQIAPKEIKPTGVDGWTKMIDSGVPDENLQARTRGTIMMGLCNYFNGILLSTGNKSEMAVGYCTIYGDMCGGLSVIADVYKTWVYRISEFINHASQTEIIPWNTIRKPPSAELRPGQHDQQSLPPYNVLDEILGRFVDKQQGVKKIIEDMVSVESEMEYFKATKASGKVRNLREDIHWVCNAVIRNEFKRKQAAPGLKVTPKHFKYGWHMPIVHGMKV